MSVYDVGNAVGGFTFAVWEALFAINICDLLYIYIWACNVALRYVRKVCSLRKFAQVMWPKFMGLLSFFYYI